MQNSNNIDPNFGSYLNVSYVGFFTVFLACVYGVFYYITNIYKPVTPDQNSINKLQQIQTVFQSLLGNNWYPILITFGVILVLIFVLLYIVSNTWININVDNVNTLNILSIIITIVFSIAIITIAVRDILDTPTVSNALTNNLSSYTGLSTFNTDLQIVEIIGLGLFILFAVVIFVWYFFFKKPTVPQQPTPTPIAKTVAASTPAPPAPKTEKYISKRILPKRNKNSRRKRRWKSPCKSY